MRNNNPRHDILLLGQGAGVLLLAIFFSWSSVAYGQKRVLDHQLHHLRIGQKPEWTEFPQQAEGGQLLVHFFAHANTTAHTLRLRQQDVKQAWKVWLNDHVLGMLVRDEHDMITYLNIPPGALNAGENTLRIETADTIPDDIRVGQMVLESSPPDQVLSEATLQVEVVDGEHSKLLPARITVTGTQSVLQTVGGSTDEQVAIRPGFVYTGNGKASFGLPAGTYTIYAGRGFEYGMDSVRLVLKPGDHLRHRFTIQREVPTEGWVCSDTHIHTFTYSGHGDATIEERVLTIAGEGIELPVITEHNRQVDIRAVAEAMKVDSCFTPVIGNEVTTNVGHFNIFPVAAGAPVPDPQAKDWQEVSRNIHAIPGVEAIILNHARDLHAGFRPFGPEHHIAVAGMNIDGWELPANAMEVVNSGAQQTDIMCLYRDWFGMLNRGYLLTPAGASDSHDVSRYLLGQARTYIRSQDDDPGRIDVHTAVKNFREGKVMVSFGLLAEITVDSLYGPGDLVPASDPVIVAVQVLGPGWTNAGSVSLYANGQKIREAFIPKEEGNTPGVKWRGTWTLPRPKHDMFLAAIAEGPGHHMPFWPIAKPYQPTSPDWSPRVIGSTGAVWIDADRDGHYTSAYGYAKALLKSAKGDFHKLIAALAAYDEAVAVQAAALLQEQGWDLAAPEISLVLQQAAPPTRAGFRNFMEAWQASDAAQKAH